MGDDPTICSICGQRPRSGYVMMHGKCLCETCWRKKFPYCRSCGARLEFNMVVSYFKTKDGEDVPYCPKCAHNPVCSVCGLPIQTGHRKISEGSVVCSECFSAAQQDSPERIAEAWRPVCDFMAERFDFHVRSPLPQLVTKAQFAELTGGTGPTFEEGAYLASYRIRSGVFSLLGGSEKTFSRCQIYILRGLSTARAEEVLAHEAGHDLLDSMLPDFSEKFYSEGFAQYVSAEYNVYRDRPERNQLIFSHHDPIYGDGVRKVRKIVEETGFQGLMDFLKARYHERS